MSTLMHASTQWQTRPADERYESLAALDAAVQRHRAMAQEAPGTRLSTLRVAVADDQPVLVGQTGDMAQFTHYAFGQVAGLVKAPAAFLRGLSPELVADNLNYQFQHGREGDATVKLLLAENGGLTLRAATGDGYRRIWDADITSRLIRLTEQSPEWQPAPAAFDGSRGLYGSDHDLFAFLVDNDRRIFESAPGGGLSRGFFVSNSEVGDASFRLTTFLYQHICGNHIVWGASGVHELRIPHIGDADERAFRQMSLELRKYADSSMAGEEAKVESAMRFTLGGTKDEVLDAVFGLGVPRGLASKAFDKAEEHEAWYAAPPTSAFGFTSGLTEIARDLPHTDSRVAMERLAGKVLQRAF